MVTVYQVTKDLPAFTTLSSENTEPTEVPQRWAADNTVLKSADIDGRVIAVPLTPARRSAPTCWSRRATSIRPSARSPSTSMPSPALPAGSGRATGSTSTPCSPRSRAWRSSPGSWWRTSAWSRWPVSCRSSSPDEKTIQNVIPVTLALQPDAALSVTYANSFAAEVRLVGLPPGVAQDRSRERKTFDARSWAARPSGTMTGARMIGELECRSWRAGEPMNKVVIAVADQVIAQELRSRLDEVDAEIEVAFVADSTQEMVSAVLAHAPALLFVHDQLGPAPVPHRCGT